MKPLHPKWNELEPNEKRTLRQQQIHESWLSAGARGYVLAVVGFGKSRLGEKGIIRCLEPDKSRTVNIIVPSTLIRNQWQAMIDRHKWNTVKVYISASYLGLSAQERTCNLLVVDECHRYSREDSLVFSKIIDSTKKNWTLCLSATMDKEQRAFLEERGIPMVGEVTLKEATREEYVAKHDIYALSLSLTPEDEVEYEGLTTVFNEASAFFGWSFDKAKYMMTKDAYEERAKIEKEKSWVQGTVFNLARSYFTSMREIRTFLQTPKSKIDAVKSLCELFHNKKIITFSEHTDFVSRLTVALGDRAIEYHSKIPTQYFDPSGARVDITLDQYKLRRASKLKYTRKGSAKVKEANIKLFSETNGLILNTANAVNEGADIQGVDMAIIISYSSKSQQLNQRLGRAIRYLKGKHAVVVILYVKSAKYTTQELNWLKKASKGMDLEWISSIDELTVSLTNKGYAP